MEYKQVEEDNEDKKADIEEEEKISVVIPDDEQPALNEEAECFIENEKIDPVEEV